LRVEWSVPELKDSLPSENEPSLIRLKYSYKFDTVFGEPCDEWIEAIEDRCNKVLGNFNKRRME
jgi:hypothetical protein